MYLPLDGLGPGFGLLDGTVICSISTLCLAEGLGSDTRGSVTLTSFTPVQHTEYQLHNANIMH